MGPRLLVRGSSGHFARQRSDRFRTYEWYENGRLVREARGKLKADEVRAIGVELKYKTFSDKVVVSRLDNLRMFKVIFYINGHEYVRAERFDGKVAARKLTREAERRLLEKAKENRAKRKKGEASKAASKAAKRKQRRVTSKVVKKAKKGKRPRGRNSKVPKVKRSKRAKSGRRSKGKAKR